MSSDSSKQGSRLLSAGMKVSGILIPALVGLLACSTAIALSDAITNRRLLVAVAALAMGIVALRIGRFREACLGLWVLFLSYPRTYYLDSGGHGIHGPYLVVSDVFLVALYCSWWFDVAVRKQAQAAQASAWWPWLVPLAIAAIWSGFEANRPDWTAFEMLRILRFGLILLYLRFNLSWRNLMLVTAACLLAVGAQSTLGLVQVTTRRFGVTALAGEEFIRAAGMLGHPNVFAAFLLIQLPMVLALAASLRTRWQVLGCYVVAVLAVGALGGSMSRTAWALTAAELLVMAVVLVGLRLVRPQFVIGVAAIALALLALMAIPIRDKIARRFSGNLRESIDARQELNRLALQIWRKNPAHGVGLNNFEEALTQIAPEWDLELVYGEQLSPRYVRMRVLVHNVWLLILAETGWVGLGAFIWILLGVLLRSVRLMGHRLAGVRALGAGAATGLLAVATQQFLEYTLWTDSILLTVALLAGMIAALPASFNDRNASVSEVFAR